LEKRGLPLGEPLFYAKKSVKFEADNCG
jgi:hypothetical protein